MKINAENRSATLSVRAKLRKALAVADSPLVKADVSKIESVIAKLDKALAPAADAKVAA